MIPRPGENEFAPYYLTYVSLVPEDDLLPVLHSQLQDLRKVVAAVPAERETFRYGPGKWSIREVIGHLIDGERVFGYRTFCIGRGEPASLPTFDENQYVRLSHYDEIPLAELTAEFELTRRSNLRFLARMTEETSTWTGTVGGNPVSVRAVVCIMIGHVRHHINVLRQSYGVPEGV